MWKFRKLFNKIYESGGYVNGAKYGWLIGCAIRAEWVISSWELFNWFSIFILSNSKQEEIDKFYQEIKDRDLQLTESSYSFIARAYASKLDVDNCIRMHKELVSVDRDNHKDLNYKYLSYMELAKNGAKEEQLKKVFNW